MRASRSLVPLAALAAILLSVPAADAQPFLDLPLASPPAEVGQAIGLTDVTIRYHRPQVQEREIWGALVPYDQVWRAGANDNTTITFSHDVEIEGEPLPAGTYGLHMVPHEDRWEIAFSHNSTSWGSFSYDPEEDALRVEVEPRRTEEPREALTYLFEDLAPDAATAVLAWERLEVPFRISVDLHGQVLANIENELRHIAGFTWQGFQQAANYCVTNDLDCPEAMGWIDRSIGMQENFANLQTKSQLLRRAGNEEEADATMARALELATPLQVHGYGRQLIAQGKVDEAMEIFRRNARENPDTWFVHIGLARGLSAQGDLEAAAEAMRKGAAAAPEAQRAVYEGFAEQLEKGQAL